MKLVVSRRPVGKVGETHSVFPGLSIGDRACAVRRGSAPPTIHKFTAPARHGVRRPAPSQPLIGRGKPRPVFASRAPDAAATDYTRRRDNAHKIEELEVLYPWHPWFGRVVHVHEVIEQRAGGVLRCSLDGDASRRWRELPQWMFDRAAIGDGAEQGWSASLSGDGNTAIVGGLIDNNLAGAAWVYTQPTFAGIPGKANCFGQSVTGCKGSSAASMPRPQPWGSQASGHCRMQFWRFAADSSSVSCSLRAVSRVPMPGRIDHAEMRPDRMERRMGLIPASPNSAVFGSGSAPRATLRFKASIRLMTLGGSAIARGVVASPFVFASTSSHSAL